MTVVVVLYFRREVNKKITPPAKKIAGGVCFFINQRLLLLHVVAAEGIVAVGDLEGHDAVFDLDVVKFVVFEELGLDGRSDNALPAGGCGGRE